MMDVPAVRRVSSSDEGLSDGVRQVLMLELQRRHYLIGTVRFTTVPLMRASLISRITLIYSSHLTKNSLKRRPYRQKCTRNKETIRDWYIGVGTLWLVLEMYNGTPHNKLVLMCLSNKQLLAVDQKKSYRTIIRMEIEDT